MNTKPMPGVMLYFDRLSFLDRLDDAQTGRLFRALIRYARDGEAPIIEDVMFGVVWDVLRPMVDYDAQKYAEVCEKRRRGIQQRWEKVHQIHIQIHPHSQPESGTGLLKTSVVVENRKRWEALSVLGYIGAKILRLRFAPLRMTGR